jgi:hypothetical protein
MQKGNHEKIEVILTVHAEIFNYFLIIHVMRRKEEDGKMEITVFLIVHITEKRLSN